jgi:GT2 family glycosyltransferase
MKAAVAPSVTLALIIPSVNRPTILHETICALARQRRSPAEIVVPVPGDQHILAETRALPRVRVVCAELGLTRQRNEAIATLAPGIELVTFLDDDVELHADYLDQIALAFAAAPGIVLADGRVLADGARTGGIERRRAMELAAAPIAPAAPVIEDSAPEFVYGCNMSVRRTALSEVRFDERLPLYGYMEDRDFAFQCARLGAVVRCTSAAMVHLGLQTGRVSGRRFGFSQVMNPLYLWRKGSYRSRRSVARQVLRPIVTNAALALMPGQNVDRRGRLAGNCRALARALRGRIAPEDMLQL